MYTKCTQCNKGYEIEDSCFGQEIQCKYCQTTFRAVMHAPNPTIDLEDSEDEQNIDEKDTDSQKKRKNTKEVVAEQISKIENGLQEMLPRIQTSIANNDNESDTRLILDRILQDILGYKIEDIKTEQRIQGKKADYVLSAKGQDVLVIEAKRVCLSLRNNHIFQATAYSAYSGIKWVLLTNTVSWQLYRVLTAEKIESDLVFSIDLRNGINDQIVQYFYLLSKHGIARKGLIEKLYCKVNALSNESLINAILTDNVISRIKNIINKSANCKVNDNEVRNCIEQNLFQLE